MAFSTSGSARPARMTPAISTLPIGDSELSASVRRFCTESSRRAIRSRRRRTKRRGMSFRRRKLTNRSSTTVIANMDSDPSAA